MAEDLLTDLRSIDPLFERTVDHELLAASRDDLVSQIVADQSTESATTGLQWRSPRLALRLALAFSVVVLVAVVAVLAGKGGPAEQRPAYASQLVEFAESTPLVLLDSPGFQVGNAQGGGENGGMMTFERDGLGLPSIYAELNWSGNPSFEYWIRDRANAAEQLSDDAPVLGTEAQVFEYAIYGGRHDLTALWEMDGQTLEMRSQVPDVAMFLEMLSSLEQVDVDTWLDAMPPSVIRSADPTGEAKAMLEGVPLPPGFDVSEIDVPGLAQDRYNFGADVIGTVACAWFAHWSKARSNGDTAAEKDAIRAMATSRDWPILKEMDRAGLYPAAIWGFADAMESAKWVGRPLEGDVNSGLGCRSKGVTLRNPGSQR